jgi:hypothetical protein
MPNDTDLAAAAFISELWSKRARAFGRLYWLHLSRNRPRPNDPAIFHANWIAKRLERIWRAQHVSFREN